MKKAPVKTWSTPVADSEKRLVPCAVCGGVNFRASLDCGEFSYVRCVSCGLVQMNPQPLAGEIKRRYNIDGFGEDYLAYETANEDAFLNLQLLALKDSGFDGVEAEIKSAADRNMRPRVLDIGCATGSLLVSLRESGWETTGVEISAPQAEYCRRRKQLDVRNIPLEENNFNGGSFDVVLASHLIEHLNDPAALVREVRRVLAPEGRFFVTTPNIAGLQALLFKGRWRSAIFDHLYLFSIKTLKRLLAENGFAVEKTATWGGLAAGTAPLKVKRVFDKAAKRFGFGDVMIMRARKNNSAGL